MLKREKLVIFICTGNTCRSPMAEALFKRSLNEKGLENIKVLSRGLSAVGGESATENAIKVMLEYGLDISHHRAFPLSESELGADLFVCMTVSHAAMLISCGVSEGKILVLNVPDPFGGDLEDYRECAAKISLGLEQVYELI